MKFKFNYEKLLEHYRLQEHIARRDYTESQAALDAEKVKYKRMYEDLDYAMGEVARARGNPAGVAIAQLVELDDYMAGQKIKITRQREVVINHTAIVEQKQEILIAAAKETKILEKLKEKRLQEFKKMQKKLDAKLTDELVVTRFRAGDRG